jgi:hypothetical protein
MLAAAPAFAATSIDFETTGLGAPTTIGGAVNGDYSNLGLSFDGASYFQCGGGCPTPDHGAFISGANTLSPFTVTFAGLADNFSAVNVSFSSVIATAFDSSNNVLGSDSSFTNFNLDDILLPYSGISYITFSFNGDQAGYGVDNFSWTPEGGVPEPSTWAMMLLGFGAVGFSLRRTRAKKLALA